MDFGGIATVITALVALITALVTAGRALYTAIRTQGKADALAEQAKQTVLALQEEVAEKDHKLAECEREKAWLRSVISTLQQGRQP